MKTVNKQIRIEEAEKFFNLLFGNVTERKFGYLWTKQDKVTYPFTVSNPDERRKMALKAIELSDSGFDVYYGVNLTDNAPEKKRRVKAEEVTMQTATVTDIDTEGGNHISDDQKKYPPTFDVAKSFLPFETSLTVNSGYGLHAFCLYSDPIGITTENKKACEERNKKFLDVIRSRSGIYSKAVDSVGDLPRILRVPGTFNYKCGKDNAPLCQVVDVSELRFTPYDIDERLDALTPAREKTEQGRQTDNHTAELICQSTDSREFDIWRATKMLAVIPAADLSRDDWLNVGMALKNNGNGVSDWELWSRNDERYHKDECETLWKGFNSDGLTIATICDIATRYGYDAKAIYDEWCDLHPEFKTKTTHQPAPMNDDEPTENFIWTRDRIKNCPVNLRLPSNYLFTREGITLVVPPKKDGDKPKYIYVATPIIPVKSFRDATKHTVIYEIAMLAKRKWHTAEVIGKTLSDPRAVLDFANYDASIDEPKYLCKFFTAVKNLNQDLLELKAFNQTGWTDDDCEEFAYPSAEGNAVIRRTGYNYEKIFKPKGDREEWKKKFIEVTEQGGAVAHAIIGGACAIPLVKPLNLPNLQVHLHGKKSIGKTPMLKFAISVFGDAKVGALTHTFAATPKSRLETACAFCDLPLICEELESISAKDAEKLSQDIYNFYLGVGGQALKRDGTLRDPKLFNSGRFTSGEHSLVQSFGNGGEFKRVLELRCSTLLDEDFASDLYGFCERNHGLFGEEWINYTIANRDLISKHYHQTLDTIKAEQKQNANENDLTQLRTLVISAIVYQHFKIFLGFQEIGNNLELANDLDAIIRTLPTAADIDDTPRAITALSSFIVGHEKNFYTKSNAIGDALAVGFANDYYGIRLGNTEYAFLPHALKKILENELKFKSADKLIAEFYDRGILIANKGRRDHAIVIGKKSSKFYHFKAGILFKDAETAELDYYESLGVIDQK